MKKNIQNIDHGLIDSSKFKYRPVIKLNSEYKEINTDQDPYQIENLEYINIYYYNTNKIIVTTPLMVCPFALEVNNGNSFKLQFTNYKTDTEMNSFYNFITNIEFQQMKYIGINKSTIDDYISQIKYDKNNKYDPLLAVKAPFRYNKYNVDIYHDKYNLNIQNINKFSNVVCDIYLDKIWKYNGKYISKWKLKSIYVK